MNSDILLIAINAGYTHTSMSLRCILANLGVLESQARILEFDSQLTTLQMVEQIIECNPKIVAFSTYIWNAMTVADVLRLLQTVRPDIRRVAGGPQMVPGDDPSMILPMLDVAVCGEGEGIMRSVLGRLLAGEAVEHLVVAEPPDLATVELPYRLYTDEDLAHRMVYVEATRGCPFRCEYCTSSGSGGIRNFPIDRLLEAFGVLLDRGVRQFKFLDRSFNFGGEQSLAVFDFFLARQFSGLRLHFEFTPDALNEAWCSRLRRFEPGMLHIEMGVQTWNPAVAKCIHRPLKPAAVVKALQFMIDDAKADVHADLIVGLPGESFASFKAGFDKLVAIGPSEIQVGILKRLPGTAIGKHDEAYSVKWSPVPPYEILENSLLSFVQMREMERFSRCWDLLYNRKRFRTSAPLFWRDGASPFDCVVKVTTCVYGKCGRMHAISPKRLAEAIFEVLVQDCGIAVAEAKAALERDAREAAWDRS